MCCKCVSLKRVGYFRPKPTIRSIPICAVQMMAYPMPSFSSLAVYVVTVRKANHRKKETLSSILGEHDLLDVLKDYFTQIKKESPDNEGSQILLRVLNFSENDRSLLGMLETGAYGDETVLCERKTKKDVYKRTRDIADMWPFYFHFHIPKGTNEGILIIQRRGNYTAWQQVTCLMQ